MGKCFGPVQTRLPITQQAPNEIEPKWGDGPPQWWEWLALLFIGTALSVAIGALFL